MSGRLPGPVRPGSEIPVWRWSPGPMSRYLQLGAACALVLVLTACASPRPPPQLYQLRAEPPVASVPAPPTATVPLQLLPVSLPELLARDALLVPQGRAGVLALVGHRWAEPLQDAVPRLLRQDLAVLLGADRVWAAPLPAGVLPPRQVRIDVLSFQVDETRRDVTLRARWTVGDTRGAAPARTRTDTVVAPVQGGDVDAIAAAHRMALWQFAQLLATDLAR
jgi:uncharacterized protein